MPDTVGGTDDSPSVSTYTPPPASVFPDTVTAAESERVSTITVDDEDDGRVTVFADTVTDESDNTYTGVADDDMPENVEFVIDTGHATQSGYVDDDEFRLADTGDDAYLTVARSNDIEPAWSRPTRDTWMPDQSPADGADVDPSRFVSPPTVSSRSDVNTTGEPGEPVTSSEPSTNSDAPASALTTLPAFTVIVTPTGTLTDAAPHHQPPYPITNGSPSEDGTVKSSASIPDSAIPLPAFAAAVFPDNSAGFNRPSTRTANPVVDDTALFDTVGGGDDSNEPIPDVWTSTPPPAKVLSDTVTTAESDLVATITVADDDEGRITVFPDTVTDESEYTYTGVDDDAIPENVEFVIDTGHAAQAG